MRLYKSQLNSICSLYATYIAAAISMAGEQGRNTSAEQFKYNKLYSRGVGENFNFNFSGETSENPGELSIRLSCGEKSYDDAPLVLKADSKRKIVSFSVFDSASLIQDKAETIQTDYFGRAMKFNIKIKCTVEGFSIQIGETKHHMIHRLPFYTIRHLMVEGHNITLRGDTVRELGQGEEQNAIPVSEAFPDQYNKVKCVVQGIPVRASPNRMEIDFTTEHGIIAFRFNPCFRDEILVRKAQKRNEGLCKNIKWCHEKTDLAIPFPFTYGVTFKLEFHVHGDTFNVKLNGNPLCQFIRTTEERQQPLKEMKINGSVVINEAKVVNIP